MTEGQAADEQSATTAAEGAEPRQPAAEGADPQQPADGAEPQATTESAEPRQPASDGAEPQQATDQPSAEQSDAAVQAGETQPNEDEKPASEQPAEGEAAGEAQLPADQTPAAESQVLVKTATRLRHGFFAHDNSTGLVSAEVHSCRRDMVLLELMISPSIERSQQPYNAGRERHTCAKVLRHPKLFCIERRRRARHKTRLQRASPRANSPRRARRRSRKAAAAPGSCCAPGGSDDAEVAPVCWFCKLATSQVYSLWFAVAIARLLSIAATGLSFDRQILADRACKTATFTTFAVLAVKSAE